MAGRDASEEVPVGYAGVECQGPAGSTQAAQRGPAVGVGEVGGESEAADIMEAAEGFFGVRRQADFAWGSPAASMPRSLALAWSLRSSGI